MPTKRIPRHYIAPELLQQGEKLPWRTAESAMMEAAVNLEDRTAQVPGISTEEEALTRLHELAHVAWSPQDWLATLSQAAKTHHIPPNSVSIDTLSRLGKMLEEVRIDAKLWRDKGVDMRPVREQYDWSKVPVPTDPLELTEIVLQLAWTVWASFNFNPDMPPTRAVDPQISSYMEKAWSGLTGRDPILAEVVSQAYAEVVREPTSEMRDEQLAALAKFFPPKTIAKSPVPLKEEVKKKLEEAKKEEKEADEREEKRKSGADATPDTKGGYFDIHDHTASIKRPSMKIRRKETPVGYGNKLTFSHRWMMDRSVFARRTLTEGGIMIDGSGSMNWTDEDLQAILSKLPAVWVGIYSGFYGASRGQLGRICVLAKKGRWSTYTHEKGKGFGNEIDLEALELLARWPKPRIWLSDGEVCGGIHDLPDPSAKGIMMQSHGPLVTACTKVMKRHEILRVHTKEELLQLISGQRITAYRTPLNFQKFFKRLGIPATPSDIRYHFGSTTDEPVKFHL